ncbi:MAG: UDP-N-acetylmuramate dehydrogenase [Clostridia bacterium]|nr:UDP-N-acetylmuramate dehydrogenase [Clostridia bacterium]
MNDKFKDFLIEKKIEFYENFDSSSISSIKIGSVLTVAIFPKSTTDFERLLKFLWQNKIAFRIFGNASNVLFVEQINYVSIFTCKMNDEILINGNTFSVSAGSQMPKLSEKFKKLGISGFEGLSGIPATIGGMIKNNAGAFGYGISDNLIKVKVFHNGQIEERLKCEIKFSHHRSNLEGFIIISATFLFEKKNEYDIIKLCNEFAYKRGISQPGGYSLGSVFCKTLNRSAGYYIERCGLKNTKIGGIIISNKHANFFINDGSATAMDFLRLMSQVQNTVEKQFGVKLIPEIEKVGNKNETFVRLSHPFKI